MRHQDWPLRLTGIIQSALRKPFAWGEHDCCLFAANTVLALTGVDHAADLRGKYTSALEAARIIKPRGGVRGIATAALGEEINPKLAQRGDIVLIAAEHGDTLAVCIGAQCAAPGMEGLNVLPMSKAVAAWRAS